MRRYQQPGVSVAAPSRPIERGLPIPSLLAQVIGAKYADLCPLYRQEGIYRRSGVELPRAMLASWVGETARLRDPLVEALERHVLSAASSMPMTRRYPCRHRGMAAPRPGDCGHQACPNVS